MNEIGEKNQQINKIVYFKYFQFLFLLKRSSFFSNKYRENSNNRTIFTQNSKSIHRDVFVHVVYNWINSLTLKKFYNNVNII